jgi:hypothetical protein
MPLQTRIQLFTTQLLTSKERLEGLEASIIVNSSEKAIAEIVILAEGLNQTDQKDLERRYPKLRMLPCNERPDFALLVQTACDYGHPDAIKVISNSDIWLDLEHSDLASLLTAFRNNSNLVFTLTRRQDDHPEQLLSVDGVIPEFLSSDAWVFGESPRPFPCHGIYLGIQDMERLVNATLEMQGYAIANACSWLRAVHLETTTNNYHDYNQAWLEKTVQANPLLLASNLPEARVVLPPCHGHLDREPLNYEHFTPSWGEFIHRWILVDLLQASHADSRLSLLWLLALAYNHNRFLIAYVGQETDPAIIDLLDSFHILTGRSLCIKGFSIKSLMEQNPSRDRCWASSPAVIGPEMIKSHLPLICRSCKEQNPIKLSWLNLYQKNKTTLHDQLRVLKGIDPKGADILVRFSQDRPYRWLESVLVVCSEWIYANAARYIILLRSVLPVNPEIRRRVRNLDKRSKPPGYILEVKNKQSQQLLRKLKCWISRRKLS